jgi:hypothetical protein
MIDVYGLKPVNKTAALVTGQSGCSTDDTLTDEQKRENLVARIKSIHKEIFASKKGSPERKALGIKQFEIQQQIIAFRPKKRSPGVVRYLLDILKEDLSPFEWDRLMDRANARMKAEKEDL